MQCGSVKVTLIFTQQTWFRTFSPRSWQDGDRFFFWLATSEFCALHGGPVLSWLL